MGVVADLALIHQTTTLTKRDSTDNEVITPRGTHVTTEPTQTLMTSKLVYSTLSGVENYNLINSLVEVRGVVV